MAAMTEIEQPFLLLLSRDGQGVSPVLRRAFPGGLSPLPCALHESRPEHSVILGPSQGTEAHTPRPAALASFTDNRMRPAHSPRPFCEWPPRVTPGVSPMRVTELPVCRDQRRSLQLALRCHKLSLSICDVLVTGLVAGNIGTRKTSCLPLRNSQPLWGSVLVLPKRDCSCGPAS